MTNRDSLCGLIIAIIQITAVKVYLVLVGGYILSLFVEPVALLKAEKQLLKQ